MKRTPDTDFLREWLEETEGGPADPVEGTRRAMSHVHETKQASRWLPIPVFYQGAQTTARPAAATDTIEYQPSPIPATNGHTPTVIGRTQSMLSPAKAITAALVFAIGGVMLVAQPFQQQSSMPGAEVQPPPADAVVFDGRAGLGGEFLNQGTSSVSPDGVRQGSGWSMTDVWEASDPRLSGDVTFVRDYTEFPGLDGVAVETGSRRLVNDEGSWSAIVPSTAASGLPTIDVFTFTGEGGYAGLSAYVVYDYEAGTFEGAIFPGTYPEPPATE